MIKILHKCFFPMLMLIVFVMSIALTNEILTERGQLIVGHIGDGETTSTGINTTPVPQQPYYPSDVQYREAVIVYFKEMPASIEEFSSSYDVKLIFVKENILMAAFETSSVKLPGVTSQKTRDFIASVSRDPRVESAKEDTYQFINKNNTIRSTPIVVDISALSRNGTAYVPDQVIVGFWKLPSSIESFGEKYGGKPVNLSENNLQSQSILFETQDVSNFINGVSNDPYVSYVNVNVIGHVV